jgi:hypothetical protein
MAPPLPLARQLRAERATHEAAGRYLWAAGPHFKEPAGAYLCCYVILYGKLYRLFWGLFLFYLAPASELEKAHFCSNVSNVAHPYVSAKLST